MLQQRNIVGGDIGVASQERGDVAIGHVGEKGNDLIADPDSAKASVGIHLVDDGAQTELRTQRLRLRPPDTQEWPRPAARTGPSHRRHTVEPGPAQQVQNDGLGEIIGGMAGADVRGEHVVPGLSRSFFEVGSVDQSKTMDDALDAQSIGERRN